MLKIVEITTKKQRKDFVKFQFEIYKNQKNWVPPLIKDEINYLDPDKNPAIRKTNAKFYLFYKENNLVGRLGICINEQYNQKVGCKYLRIIKPEFIEDYEVFREMMDFVFDYANKAGLEKVHGPLGFTNLDTQGLLIEGFEHLQSIASVYHLPYYKDFFEKYGFEKENDWVEFRITLDEEVINKGIKVAEMLQKRYNYTIVNFNTTQELLKYKHDFFETLFEAFDVLPYVARFDEQMVDFYTHKYFSSINPKYVTIVLKDDEFAGFILPIPSLSKAFQKANGRLLPFGLFHLLKAMKKNDTADFLLTGVRKKYQNLGVAVILFTAAQKKLWDNGIRFIETTGIFETNDEVINNWKYFNHVLHKRRRCFVKKIS